MTTLVFTVTNDLTYDQRMQRICSTLATEGYTVWLVGRELAQSSPLEKQLFEQKRLKCQFNKGFLFYAEFNIRLFVWLLGANMDAVCSIDYDTLPAGCLATLIRRKKRIFDAHEYFTEVPEVVNRPFVRLFWATVARIFLPFYRYAYTVGPGLSAIFEQRFGLKFSVIRNVPALKSFNQPHETPVQKSGIPILLYQGALNEGRGIEYLLEAMQHIDGAELWLAGEGDLSATLRAKSIELKVQQKVRFLGFVKPDDLKKLTTQTTISLNLLENRGLSYYYSLANKFFDSVQAAVPVITMNFPEYAALNKEYEVALLLDNLSADAIVKAIHRLLQDDTYYKKLQKNCVAARLVWNWEREKETLTAFYRQIFKEDAITNK